MKMTNYRIYFEDMNDHGGSDEPNGYRAIINAQRLSGTYGKIAVKEQRGSRWYKIAEAVDGELVFTGKAKDYYILPTDQYNQPNGDIKTVSMTKGEAILYHRNGYIFDNYVDACYRAQD